MEENMYNALLMGAAMLVFVIAITTIFSLISLTKTTSDSILYAYDDTKYYEGDLEDKLEGITYTKANSNDLSRIVGMETIIPTIYRYINENYGVTIVGSKGNVIARFDSDTESLVNGWATIVNGKADPKNANSLYDKLTTNLKSVTIYTYDENGIINRNQND